MSKIVGIDPGTNSIGWSVIDTEKKCIIGDGSRIIPMDQGILGDFEAGNSVSQTKERTEKRMIRRVHERRLLRRQRLNRVLSILDFLPEHYAAHLDRYGNLTKGEEPKIAWREGKNGVMEFLFQKSYNEMLEEFRKSQPDLLAEGRKIPYDWTIYYLRKKGLTQALTKEELAWVLMHFNQKRGYYQLRGEEVEENSNKKEEFYSLKVLSVEPTGEKDKKSGGLWYRITFENGWEYNRPSKFTLDWVGKIKDMIVTTQLNDDGSEKVDKDGIVKRTFRIPKEDDWKLKKIRTEYTIRQSDKTIGQYIYDTLLERPSQKIIGQLVRTVERKFYKTELKAILSKQKELIPELRDSFLYDQCIKALYPANSAYRNSIANRDFVYLLMDDILFYQRPLKSKKNLIDDCPYESRYYKDNNTGKEKLVPVKCVAKSSPLFQEFRLWKFISDLRIYRRTAEVDGKLITDLPVTEQLLPNAKSIADLFDWMNDLGEIDQKKFFTYPGFGLKKKEIADYRWNYVEDKSYPCNKTRALILGGLKKSGVKANYLTAEKIEKLWHILYSVTDKQELEKAFASYAIKNNLPEAFATTFGKMKPFDETGYAAYSSKAIKRMLPLMRMGKYWSEEQIDVLTRQRIEKILNGEFDQNINTRTRELLQGFTSIEQFQGLPSWLVCYIVYGRHSEVKDAVKWDSPSDIDNYLKSFRQHSLNNPIVEQVVLETLRVVRDLWKQYEKIDEIHIEIGRDLKRTKAERERISKMNIDNENRNLRIKALLTEFLNPDCQIENVRPQSPSQQELFKIYEEGVLSANVPMPENIVPIFKNLSDPSKLPTHSEILRYKCWLDQKYISPYTGKIIPLGKLFTSAYQIEHVIPQSRYFDDSLSNKVICESEVNQRKDRQLGLEFIKNHHGEIVPLSMGGSVKILSVEEYQQLVQKLFANNRTKMKKLLMDELPDGFIERQINDSRYISRMLTSLLSNIVREKDANGEYEPESTSKNVIVCNGSVTDILKRDWGAGDVWNRLILPRFQRLNQLTETNNFTTVTTNGHEIPVMPLELQRGFNKKRIDHRHHAMDAIVIACCTRDHVNLINNEAALSANRSNRYALSRKLRRMEKCVINGKEVDVAKEFLKPWDTFTQDLYDALQSTVVSFKQNQRVINRTTNYYSTFKVAEGGVRTDANDNAQKGIAKQTSGDSWAIRKSLHKETIFGEVNLQLKKTISIKDAISQPERIVDAEVKHKVKQLLDDGYDAKKILQFFKEHKDVWGDVANGKVEVFYYTKGTKDRYFATRFGNDITSLLGGADKNKVEGIIDSVTDTGIQKILRAHLSDEGGDPKQAFSADGVERMNAKIQFLNGGKKHQPIYKVRTFEKAEKFAIGTIGNKITKFAEADKGTNLFFVVYKTPDKEARSFVTVPLNIIIDCQKQYQAQWKEHLVKMLKQFDKPLLPEDAQILFMLTINDLVYVPTQQEILEGINKIDKGRIYKTVSFNGPQCFCIQHQVASSIVNKMEFTTSNKMERAISKEMIKETCIPINVDRLGNITLMELE